MSEPTYISFSHEQPSKSGKTKIWAVTAKDDEYDLLGQIRWYGSWRQYAFFPAIPVKTNELVFEKTCLRDIANFCEEQTKLHHEKHGFGGAFATKLLAEEVSSRNGKGDKHAKI